MKPRLLCCTLALLLAAPLLAAPPAPAPHPTMVLLDWWGAPAYSPDGKTLAIEGAGGVWLWDTASGQAKTILTGAFGPLFSPDSRTLATGHGIYDTVQLWDVASGRLKMTLSHGGELLAFSPDGLTLAGVGWNDEGNRATVRLWEVASGRLRATLEPGLEYRRDSDVLSIGFSSGGRTLAAGGRLDAGYGAFSPGPVQLWDVASGLLKSGFDGARGPFAFAPDGSTLATERYDSATDVYSLRLWDVASGQATLTLVDVYAAVLAFSPNGKTLAAGGGSVVELWEVASGQLKKTLELDLGRLKSLAFSSDGQTLGVGGSVCRVGNSLQCVWVPGAVRLYDLGSGLLKMGCDGVVGGFAFAPDGRILATWSDDWTVRFWDVASGQLKAALKGADVVVYSALSPDGQTLATGDGVGVRLWDVARGQLKATLPRPPGVVEGLIFSPDGQRLATAGHNATTRRSTVQLWDVASGQLEATLAWPVQFQFNYLDFYFVFAPDGKTLATEHWSEVQLWDVASGQLKANLPNAFGTPVFSPDSRTLATINISDAKSALLYDVASGQLMATLKGAYDGPWVLAPAFSPDGQTLATSSYDAGNSSDAGTVRLWDVATRQLKATLKGGAGQLAFSPDSRTLATANYDTSGYIVRFWDVVGGQLKATLTDAGFPLPYSGYGVTLATLAFSTDGKTLATRDGSRHLHLWDVASASPISITAQTSLAQFPPWLTHPFSKNGPTVSLLDPVDEHILATMQALPDIPASLFAPPPDPAVPPTSGNWITTTPDGYFAGSANVAEFIRWNVDGVLYPASAYWDVYYRPDLVRQALKIPGE
jgi:WD40 repeat protein